MFFDINTSQKKPRWCVKAADVSHQITPGEPVLVVFVPPGGDIIYQNSRLMWSFFFSFSFFFVECNLICFPSVALCRCRSSHRLHRRARSQELPPEETPQTQVQPQGQAGTSRARHGGIQVGRGDRRWSRHERPQATQWVLMKCMRESITFVIWNQLGDVQRQFVNHSSRDVSVLSVKDVVTQWERGGLGGVGS